MLSPKYDFFSTNRLWMKKVRQQEKRDRFITRFCVGNNYKVIIGSSRFLFRSYYRKCDSDDFAYESRSNLTNAL